ncbi:MAG: chromosomal replication initiator protein DnaA [Spirochaetales bacterium]
MNLQEFWNEALSQLKNEIDPGEFAFYFSSLEFLSSTAEEVTLTVPSPIFRAQLEKNYLPQVRGKLLELTGRPIGVHFEIRESKSSPVLVKSGMAETHRQGPARSARKPHQQLNPDYTLEKYVVAKNNELAYSMTVAISKDPGNIYNPFFLFGGVGLGKTHLIQALGNAVHKQNEKAIVIYVQAESFINEFMTSIQNKTQSAFKNKYRNVDVLLIDDIHDLQNKKDTQEELFNTFNALYEAKKQIVFTSDRAPHELKNFAERLLNRLSRGTIADLQLPSWEIRLVILKSKIEQRGLQLPDDVLELIAKKVNTNIRDLEGALNQICAYGELLKREITLEVAQEQLKRVFAGPAQETVPIDLVQKVVAEANGLSVSDLKGKRRTQAMALPRQVAMYIIRDLTEYSTTEIGMEFGGRDHTTVMHAVQKIEDKIKTEPSFEVKVQNLIRIIKDRAGS